MPWCDQQGAGVAFHPDALQLDIHLAAEDLVQRTEGFVEEQDLRAG